MISPDIFKNIVFKHEKTIYDFQGGFNYYHNCGPLDPLIEYISEFDNILMMHSGPFSDYKIILKQFGDRSAIEHCLRSKEALMESSYEQMISYLEEIKKNYLDFKVKGLVIRATIYTKPELSIDDSIKKIKEWIQAGRKVLG